MTKYYHSSWVRFRHWSQLLPTRKKLNREKFPVRRLYFMYPLYINIENVTRRLSGFLFLLRWRKNFIEIVALSLVVCSIVNFHFVTRWYWKFRCIRYDDIRLYFVDHWIGPWKRYSALSYFHKQMQSGVKISCRDFLTFTPHASCLEQVVICKEMAFLQTPRFPRAPSMDILSEACW